MRFFEITEALTRRGFLGGLAGAAATGGAIAGPGGQHLGYEDDDQAGQLWRKLDPKSQQVWIGRQQKLQARAVSIFNRLIQTMPESDRKYTTGAKVTVPVKMALYDWANVGADRMIQIDLGTYWDLSDSAIAYTVAHEIAHIVFNGRGTHMKPGQPWPTPELKKRKVREELECDAYGAALAFRAGYDPKNAFDMMDAKSKTWRYDPNVQGSNYYPDYGMRQKNLKQAIDRAKQELDAAKQAQNSAAAQQAQQNLNQATQQLQQLQQTQPAPQPTADENQLNSMKQQVFNHVLRGIQTLYA
jgi:hypothetical protein